MEQRTAVCSRKTKETDISITLDLDGQGNHDIHTGIDFFDHMLAGFSRHGLFDLQVTCTGDLTVDCHHTVEDTGIVLGQAIRQAIGGKEGINRYGHFILPMDETLVLAAIDLSGRPFLNYNANFTVEKLGALDSEMIREFFYAISYSAGINLHLKVLDGVNNHHIAEALFKGFGKALAMAVKKESKMTGVWSTKGSL